MPYAVRDLWTRLPVLLRAVVLGYGILAFGQLPPGVFLAIGLRWTPAVPWWLIPNVAWLLIFWAYLDGRWWPSTTSGRRRELLRGNTLSPRLWFWSLVAGAFGMASVLSGALLTGLLADLPRQAYLAPLDMSRYPPWTVVAFFLNIALVAGVVEEAAFRGFMLSLLERRYGWLPAILIVAAVFYVAHLSHAYATLAFVPFFMAYSILHGVLVYLTRSTLPSVVIHAAGDFCILPIQYGVVASPMGSSVPLHVAAVLGFGALSLLGMIACYRNARAILA